MNKLARSEKVMRAFESSRSDAASGRLELVRDGRRLVFTAEPDYIRNSAGEIIGVDAWVELYDEHGNELPIDPHRRIINPPTIDSSDAEDSASAFIEAVWDSVESAPNPNGWRTAGTVTTIYVNPSDDRILSTSTSYNTARSGGSLSLDTPDAANHNVGQLRSGPTYEIREYFGEFDTSAIADTDVVSSVVLEMWLNADQSDTDFTVEVREASFGSSIDTSDWVPGESLGSLPLLATLDTNGIGSSGAYKTFTSTSAFLTASNLKTGSVQVVVSSSRTRTGNAPTGYEYVSFLTGSSAGTANDPKLTITHSASGGSGSVTFVSASVASVGTPALSNGALAAVAISPTGSGSPDFSSGSSTSIRVTESGAGSPAPSNGSSATTTAASTGAGSPGAAAGSSATVTVTGDGVGTPNTAGGSASSVTVAAPTSVTAALSGGSSSSLTASVEGAGSPSTSGGSETSGSVSASGGFSPGSGGGSEAAVSMVATGGGFADDPEGGSVASVPISVAGDGELAVSGSSTAGVGVSAEGGGRLGYSGGSSVSCSVASLLGGVANLINGSQTAIAASSEGSGRPALSTGSTASVVSPASGAGILTVSAGATAGVTIDAFGFGGSPGGSTSFVYVLAYGAGLAGGLAGGSTAGVAVKALGRGRRSRIDITVFAGQTRIGYDVKATRIQRRD